jgi:hypothetical protein
MSVYRENAASFDIEVVRTCGGLVRKNGSRCKCTPPGIIWCWWYSVGPGDAWSCVHGGSWDRIDAYGTRRFLDFWRPVTPHESSIV